jgi:type I restriction enzyme S subunit
MDKIRSFVMLGKRGLRYEFGFRCVVWGVGMSWQVKSIGEFCKTGSGGTPSRKEQERFYGGTIPWIKSGELKESTIFKTEETITETALAETSAKMIPAGALLVAMYGATIGRIATLGIPASSNQAVCHIIPDSSIVDQRYMFYALSKQVPKWIEQGVGGAQPNINQQIIRDTKIPLPPIAEQKRIAAILDKADRVRRKRKEAIRLTEELLRSAFLEMFGDPVTNPKGWEILPISRVIQNISTGWSLGGEEKELSEDEWGVLKISAVTTGRFISSEYKNVGKPPFKKHTTPPKKGDLLFTRANTRELVAATCIVEEDCERLFLPDKIWCIQPKIEIATKEYLKFLLSDSKYRDLLTKKATGTSGSMLNISQKKLLEMEAPMPPIALQNNFSKYVWRIFSLRKKYELAIVHSDSEFNSLLQRAFRGEL